MKIIIINLMRNKVNLQLKKGEKNYIKKLTKSKNI